MRLMTLLIKVVILEKLLFMATKMAIQVILVIQNLNYIQEKMILKEVVNF